MAHNATACSMSHRTGALKLIFSEVHQVPEGPLPVGHAGGRVDVAASPDETLLHARQCAEFVVPLHQRRVVGTVELQMRCARLGYQLARILREKCQLRKVRPTSTTLSDRWILSEIRG